ncbi:hypothetical protein [Sphingosinicella sp. BN140058]|uniref:hypothetical protein n=1 Tax=Sphingosinicella sp. BN140058 TaxID=1892855 RepID=UPI001010B262|nr:hypothetical protein [Sphingosinicella sp. BN140058]QAY76189.1 hypothetical protein ETR14_06335 [Sphingosinicella sp. BN140058]
MSNYNEARRLHQELEFIGLRAQATSVGFLQLCAELVKAGVIGNDGLQRIKDAIHREITCTNSRRHGRDEFETTLRQRLDAIFPRADDAVRAEPVGSIEDMEAAFGQGPAQPHA